MIRRRMRRRSKGGVRRAEGRREEGERTIVECSNLVFEGSLLTDGAVNR